MMIVLYVSQAVALMALGGSLTLLAQDLIDHHQTTSRNKDQP
jgi:hypothetical protein